MTRLIFVFICLLPAVFLPSGSGAQPSGKIFRIGILDPSTASGSAVLWDAFRQELTKLGWNEGKNITIESRFAEQKGERLPELAADLVRLNVDLIVVPDTPSSLAAMKASTTIPVVVTNSANPVGAGLVASLAKPGGNVTGTQIYRLSSIRKGWRYSKTPSPDSHELGFSGGRPQVSNKKRSGLRLGH